MNNTHKLIFSFLYIDIYMCKSKLYVYFYTNCNIYNRNHTNRYTVHTHSQLDVGSNPTLTHKIGININKCSYIIMYIK